MCLLNAAEACTVAPREGPQPHRGTVLAELAEGASCSLNDQDCSCARDPQPPKLNVKLPYLPLFLCRQNGGSRRHFDINVSCARWRQNNSEQLQDAVRSFQVGLHDTKMAIQVCAIEEKYSEKSRSPFFMVDSDWQICACPGSGGSSCAVRVEFTGASLSQERFGHSLHPYSAPRTYSP